jgi:hypothetical protein
MESTHAGTMAGMLSVRLIGATELKSFDVGANDCYAVLSIGGTSFKSTTKRNSGPSPVWHEVFEQPVDGDVSEVRERET